MKFTSSEELEFEALFGVAWALRGTPAFRPAIETIADWNADRLSRRAQVALAHRHVELEQLVRLLRETDPARATEREAA